MTLEEAALARKKAWDELYKNGKLTVLEWGQLADDLDRILDELGVKDLIHGEEE